MSKVLVLDNVDDICKQILEERGLEVAEDAKLSDEELVEKLSDKEAVIIRSATKLRAPLLEKLSNLRVIGRAGVGVDNIDVDAATKNGILVMNTPDGNTISTAEQTCGLILSAARNIPNAVDSLKNDRWDRKKYQGSELHGKKLGIVGLGKIGAEVAKRMQAFGMDVLAYDPFTTHERAQELGIELREVDELLGEVDFLTVHTPLTEKTKGLVSLKNADKLKKGIRLVNCARGGIYEEEDLIPLIEKGYVSCVALDVYSQEPPDEKLYEMLKHPQIICTPHLGASTEEAQEKVAEQIARQVADALEGKGYKGSLNGKSIALSTNAEVQPFLELAQRLGEFVAQIAPKNQDTIDLSYTGTCSKHAEVLTDAFLTGFLDESIDEMVNLISARYHADERGLKIRESHSKESKIYSDLITVDLDQDAIFHHFSATPFRDGDKRLVDINGFGIELSLEGNIVLWQNEDKPGMLAAASGKLAENNVNIANLSLGRSKKDTGQDAITAFTVDTPLKPEDIQALEDIDGVHNVSYVSLK